MKRALLIAVAALILIGSPVAASDRPPDCPRLWCGCWLAQQFGIHDGKRYRELWSARAWATFGQRANGPAPGVVAVFKRGRNGGHVGIVTGVPRKGIIVLKSGNDNGAVRERERSIKNVIAWRVP